MFFDDHFFPNFATSFGEVFTLSQVSTINYEMAFQRQETTKNVRRRIQFLHENQNTSNYTFDGVLIPGPKLDSLKAQPSFFPPHFFVLGMMMFFL